MKNSIGRNSPCWCGSGVKYKKCHLHRSEQKEVNVWDTIKSYKKEFEKKYCLCAENHNTECQGKIINAHTVSKSSSLKAISRNSHVYSFLLPVEKHLNLASEQRGVNLKPELTGINRSSTFTGFCQAHDRDVFSPIENKPFMGTKEQLFLLSYRAIARELFAKVALVNIEQSLRSVDKGKNIFEQQIHQQTTDDLIAGAVLGNEDLNFQKEHLDRILINRSFEEIEGFIVECENIPSLMCCSSLSPFFDFNGKEVQNFYDLSKRLHSVHFNILSSQGKGFVVFSWLKSDSNTAHNLINSFKKIDASRRTDAIIRFVFGNFENRFANPDWWENLTEFKQKKLAKLFHDSVSMYVDLNPKYLIDDGLNYDDWNIISTIDV